MAKGKTGGGGSIRNHAMKDQTSSTGFALKILFQILWPPTAIIGFHLVCNKNQCSFLAIPDLSEFNTLPIFFNWNSFYICFGFSLCLAVLGMLPFGGEKVKSLNRKDNFIYRTNGFNCMLTMVVSFIVMEYLRFPISKFIVEHIISLVVSMFTYLLILSVFVYLKSLYAPPNALNPAEINASTLSNFFNGRELNPRLFGLDIKVYMTRLYTTSSIIIDLSFLIHSLDVDLQYVIRNLDWKPFAIHPTLVVLVAFHVSYFVCHLYYENRLMSSHFVRSEGLGYDIIVGIFVWWSGLIAQTVYISNYQIHYPLWQLVLLSILHYFGLIYYQISNNEKDAFRKDPTSSPKFKSIKTNQGKDILCSGTWGIVRQPNIISDIIVHVTWLRFGWNVPAAIGVIALINMFIERSFVSQADCKSRYGKAWDKYCDKVEYILIPYLY